ncbi:MAG: hypothetical protein NZ516_03505 [Raineya sp.]|nr:hypothetical protein [Raineya sp.]
MKKLILLFCVFLVVGQGMAQHTEGKYLASFKITDYILKEENAYIVQVYSPKIKIPEKAIAILYDTDISQEKGYYKCLLIKGDYYYFACSTDNPNNKFKSAPQPKDALFVAMDKVPNMYFEQIGAIAAYGVEMIDTEKEEPIFQINEVLTQWTKEKEEQALQKMVDDIRLVGKYMKENNPSIDQNIENGSYKGKKLLDVMMKTEKKDVQRFLAYIKARPAKYMNNQWKVSEIFATWVVSGAPEIKK